MFEISFSSGREGFGKIRFLPNCPLSLFVCLFFSFCGGGGGGGGGGGRVCFSKPGVDNSLENCFLNNFGHTIIV